MVLFKVKEILDNQYWCKVRLDLIRALSPDGFFFFFLNTERPQNIIKHDLGLGSRSLFIYVKSTIIVT